MRERLDEIGMSQAEIVKLVGLPGLGALVTGFLCSLANLYIKRLKDERLRSLLMALVQAAEQIYGQGNGDLKRAYVLSEARAQGLGLVRTADLEAAVYGLTQGQ